MKTIIITDSCCDLSIDYIKENNLEVLPLSYNFGSECHKENFGREEDYKNFYDRLRNGEISSTSQINSFIFEEVFKKYLDLGYSIIYIAFSSELSGTYGSAISAVESLKTQNNDVDITIIDSKSASTGQGLLVYYACEMLRSGNSKESIINWVEQNKLRVNHWITVDDINHLRRGGRISKTVATIGSVLDIKPILKIDDDGRLISIGKARGRKKSIKFLADKVREKVVNQEEQTIFISHADSEDEANTLMDIIKSEINVKSVLISSMGPVVGSHVGPGTIAVFFLGDNRN
jgi:DegV family protein with EDD domain